MFGGGAVGGILGGGGLGAVLPSDMPDEGFEDFTGGQPPMQAAAGIGQGLPPGAPVRRAVRGRPAQPPMMAQAGMPMGQTRPGGGALLAAFLGGLLAAGVGYGVYRAWREG